MGKFEKAIQDSNLEPLKLTDSSTVISLESDALKFPIETTDRGIMEVDFTRYRDGDTRAGLMGFPKLIVDLLPTIKRQIGRQRRTKQAIDLWSRKWMPVFFKALTHMSQLAGNAPERADDFQDTDGVFFKSYLRELDGKASTRKKQYSAIYTILRQARSKTAPPLRWPSFDVALERNVHADVDPRAVKALYHACKRVVEEAELNFKHGQLLLAEGVDPRDFGPARLSQKGCRGPVKNPYWHNHANLAILQRLAIKDRIVGTEQIDRKAISKIHHLTAPTNKAYAGIRQSYLVAANAPSSLEVAAVILLVSMETGGIDTVWGIDPTSKWYSLRRGDKIDSLGKTDSIVLHATRPKTSKPLTAIGLAGSRFRSFQLIRGLQERTTFLRECLRERRARLEEKGPNATERTEIVEIDRRLRSPWLFFNSKGKGTLAAGLGASHTINASFPALKARAITALRPGHKQDPSLVAAIEALKWSDLRDAFASHIFEMSGRNMFLVKRALGHNDIATTRHYLRQRRQIRDRFDAFRKVFHIALTEVKEGRMVDPTLLFLASNYADFSDSYRERLTAFRTRMGMGCVNPTKPDKHLAPNHIEGTLCAVQRCVLCRHGVVFKDAYESLADRHADLTWLRSKAQPNRWLTSSLWWEMEAIELVRDNIFTDLADAFNTRSEERLTQIAAGRAYVFDDPEITGGLQ